MHVTEFHCATTNSKDYSWCWRAACLYECLNLGWCSEKRVSDAQPDW